ncbi:hypothetical protein PISMIDRAFT_620635 [Pisolithus microcarpus 441]|uniref:Uncharacterized protein n=1 Tax=Pisolithus microcarpus 441 TaxID=765257 RepID=A0A0C9YJG9_9AGAM|nr:hypothetical protein PISMIDRAFT_620635 [Pisolithus microcarpus 441]
MTIAVTSPCDYFDLMVDSCGHCTLSKYARRSTQGRVHSQEMHFSRHITRWTQAQNPALELPLLSHESGTGVLTSNSSAINPCVPRILCSVNQLGESCSSLFFRLCLITVNGYFSKL